MQPLAKEVEETAPELTEMLCEADTEVCFNLPQWTLPFALKQLLCMDLLNQQHSSKCKSGVLLDNSSFLFIANRKLPT